MNPSYHFSGIVSIAYFLLEKPDLEYIMKSTNLITEKIVHIKKEESIYLSHFRSAMEKVKLIWI